MEQALQQLIDQKVIESVTMSDWGAPIVPVLKPDSSVRICGDYNTQIPLDEASKQYVTINTHKGLFRYKRLPFGVSTAPSIFQRTMEGLLHGIPHVSLYLDDILVTGVSDEEHLTTLDKVL